MKSKNISLKEEVYERLRELKGDDESFSDVILELTEESRKDFSNIIDAGIDLEWSEIEKSREKSKEV